MDREDYVSVSEVLGLKQFKDVTLGDLLCVVENNSKIETAGEGAGLPVCASQGGRNRASEGATINGRERKGRRRRRRRRWGRKVD